MSENISENLKTLAGSVRMHVEAANKSILELQSHGVEIEFYHNRKKMPDGVFGLDFEVRMLIPVEPIKL